jgi:spore germination protein KC
VETSAGKEFPALMKSNYLWVLVLLLCLALSLSGCSGTGSIYTNYREIEQLQVIQTLGVDVNAQGVTVSVSSGTDQEKTHATLMCATGPTILLAMDKLQDYAAEEDLYYAHVNYFLIGEEAAQKGLSHYLDFIWQSTELRQNLGVFVVRGSRAEDLFSSSSDEAYDISNIMPTIQRDLELKGTGAITTCSDISRQLARQGSALICAIRCEPLEGTVFNTESKTTALPAGYGVIQDGALAAYIEEEDARGVNILLNRAGSGNISVLDDQGRPVTLSIDHCDTEISPVWGEAKGQLEAISIQCDLTAAVVEINGTADPHDQDYAAQLDEAISQEVQGWITNVTDLSQSLGADFLGLGKILEMEDPLRFAEIQENWLDLLKEVEIQITVDARAERSYDLISGIQTEGGGIDNVTGNQS